MRVLYSLFFYLCTPAVLGYFAWRARNDRRWLHGWRERLGSGGTPVPKGAIIVHAASVGEVNAAAPLIRALLERPEPLLLTAFTPTGAARARELFGERLAVRHPPLDLPGCTRRFVRAVSPRLLVVMETEIWPNLYHAAASQGVPILLANARLSERSVRTYRNFAGLVRGALEQVARALAQTDTDRERLLACGLPDQRISVAGNLKFDIDLPAGLDDQAAALRARWGADRPVWIAASTHAEDDPLVLEAFAAIAAAHRRALLILVPRHPERFDATHAAAVKAGLRTRRYSDGEAGASDMQCLVLDAMGQLLRYYACSDVAFIGGSFGPTGGHNPLEPAAFGVPVITGPDMHGFAEVMGGLETAGAAIRVEDAAGLAREVGELLSDAQRREEMGEKGRAYLAASRGALARNLSEIQALLD